MILISLVAFLWFSCLLCLLLFQCMMAAKTDALDWLTDAQCLVLGRGHFSIDKATLTLLSKLPHCNVEVDVSKEVQRLYKSRPRSVQKVLHLYSGILMTTDNAELTKLLVKIMYSYNHHCPSGSGGSQAINLATPHGVFLSVDYTLRSRSKIWSKLFTIWTTDRKAYRCYYSLFGVDDHITIPPHALRPLSYHYKTLDRCKQFKALLILQHLINNRLSRQYCCNVTETMLRISGPWGDFYKDSSCGYQLTPSITYIALSKEVQALLDKCEPYLHSNVKVSPESPLKAPSDTSSEIHRLTLRLRLQTATNKIQVINMDKFLPF